MTNPSAGSDSITRLNEALEGRYHIERELGQGGMATVYLAEDLKHERKVALKVLKPELAAVVGAERFLAEIKTTANLQHPHILPLFDSGEAGSFLFYVMPYVEGESLRDRLDREKQLPVAEAVRIATDVAEALHSAHEQGVIHRDIKPANILLSKGRPLVADFGIALAVSAAGGGRLTETGLSMGTPYYMSPEQASADRDPSPASDAYSLGCVLYEMLVGEPPHTGASAQAVLAKILTHAAPAPTEARSSIPANVDAAIRKSLEKLPADRFLGANEFAKALGDPAFRYGEPADAPGSAEEGPWRARAIGAAAVAVVALLGWSWSALRPAAAGIDYAIGVQFPEDQDFAGTETFDVAPDGSFIVYEGPMAEGGTQLWLRRWDELTGRPIPGTEGGSQPEISPDGSEMLFLITSGSLLVAGPVVGGASRILAESIECCGTWGPDGGVFAQGTGGLIVSVPSNGGPIETVAPPIEGGFQWHPRLISGGRGLVFSEGDNVERLRVLDLATREGTLLGAGSYPRVIGEQLLYLSAEGSLMAQAFDVAEMSVVGVPVTLLDGLLVTSDRDAHFAVAEESGLLVYRRGVGLGAAIPSWVERTGVSTPIDEEWKGEYRSPALSPDGTRLAVDSAGALVCVKQLPSGPCQRLSFDGTTNHRPIWGPDARTIVFASNRAKQERFDLDLYRVRSDGSSDPELIWDIEPSIAQAIWAPDGETLIYRTAVAGASVNASIGMGDGDLFWFRLGKDSIPSTFWATPSQERQPALSPDGRWLAYATNRSGRDEVVVRPFPEGDALAQVSNAGGTAPAWSPLGDELFFINSSGVLVSATVEEGPGELAVTERNELFQVEGRFFTEANQRQYDVSADGRRFIMMEFPRLEGMGRRELVLIENWVEGLRERLGN